LGIKNPVLLKKYIPEMLDNLLTPKHDAVVRNTIRVWAEMDIPEEYQGAVFEQCFGYLCNPQVAVAIRAFAISVAGNIAKKYPDLATELKSELITILQYETKPAVKVRAKRYISIL
jgi:hypothetical protein